MSNEAVAPMVLDLGAQSIKAGFADMAEPKCIIPAVVAHKTEKTRHREMDHYVGELAIARRNQMSLKWPLQNGNVQDWDDLDLVLQHVFEEQLNICDDEIHGCPMLICESPLSSKKNRETLTQMMFERVDVPAIQLVLSPLLSLLSTGKVTGLALESGADHTFCVPVYEGQALRHAITSTPFAGSRCTQYLMELFNQQSGVSFISYEDTRIVQHIKETYAYVAKDFAEEKTNLLPVQTYVTPDGRTVEVGEEKLICTEPFFGPHNVGKDNKSIQRIIFESVQESDRQLRSTFYDNIQLCGGTSLLQGFDERLCKELQGVAPAACKVIVNRPACDKAAYHPVDTSAWVGGAVLASNSTFSDTLLTKQMYMEFGESIVHDICF